MMTLVDVYVQVTAIPLDLFSRASDSPITVIVKIPGLRIESYRVRLPDKSEATDSQLAENLAREIAPQALATAGPYRHVPWFVEAVALPQRPPEAEVRPPDFAHDGIKAWLPTRQSFV